MFVVLSDEISKPSLTVFVDRPVDSEMGADDPPFWVCRKVPRAHGRYSDDVARVSTGKRLGLVVFPHRLREFPGRIGDFVFLSLVRLEGKHAFAVPANFRIQLGDNKYSSRLPHIAALCAADPDSAYRMLIDNVTADAYEFRDRLCIKR